MRAAFRDSRSRSGLAALAASKVGRGNADPALVRAAERGLRAVANLIRDFGEAHRRAGEERRGELHAPLGEVLHRWHADEVREAFC